MAAAQTVEILLRGVAIGALACWAVGLTVGRGRSALRLTGALFCLSAIGYAFNEYPTLRAVIGVLTYPLWLLSVAAVGYFWLFAVTLFEDRRLTAAAMAPPLLLTLIGLSAYAGPEGFWSYLWISHHLLEIGLAAHVLLVVMRSWRGDLVELRRRLRGPFMAAATLFAMTLAGLQITAILRPDAPQPSLAVAWALAGLCIAGASVFLQARTGLFGAAARDAANVALTSDPLEQAALVRLGRLMTQEALWRRERLTIADLAEAVGVGEHRLRRLINDHLGHRNFSAFVNEHRVMAAKAALDDPANARRTVAAIAFDLGFGSLGPFNRAFREATGLTPTAYRRRLDAEIAMNPEKAGRIRNRAGSPEFGEM